MLRNITLSADDLLIRKARNRAAEEHKSLNALFRDWIKRYVGSEGRSQGYRRLMKHLSHVKAGGKFTRDEMNER